MLNLCFAQMQIVFVMQCVRARSTHACHAITLNGRTNCLPAYMRTTYPYYIYCSVHKCEFKYEGAMGVRFAHSLLRVMFRESKQNIYRKNAFRQSCLVLFTAH